MNPSKQAKQAGLASLAELSRISTVSVTTLRDWHKSKSELFSFMCKAGAIISSDIKGERNENHKVGFIMVYGKLNIIFKRCYAFMCCYVGLTWKL